MQKENRKLQTMYVTMDKEPAKFTPEQHQQVKDAL
jgi:hypothetical protein